MWSFSNSFLLQNGFVSSLQLCNCQGQYHKMYQKYQKYGFCFDKFSRDWSRLISIKIYMLCRIESKTLFIENDQCSTGFVCESSFPLHCQRPRANITWKGSLVKDGKQLPLRYQFYFQILDGDDEGKPAITEDRREVREFRSYAPSSFQLIADYAESSNQNSEQLRDCFQIRF